MSPAGKSMAGAHGSASRWQRRRREVVEEGRSRKIGVGMVLSMGAKLCCGTCMDTGGDATPKHLPVSHTHTAAARTNRARPA